jgi:hypothetical protein
VTSAKIYRLRRIGRTPHNLETLIEKKFLQLEGDQGFIFDNQHAHRLKLFCPGRAKGIPSEAFRAPGISGISGIWFLQNFAIPAAGRVFKEDDKGSEKGGKALRALLRAEVVRATMPADSVTLLFGDEKPDFMDSPPADSVPIRI